MLLSLVSPTFLFDHLVGPGQHGRRDVDTKLFRRLEIDDQFEPGGLHDGQFGGLFPLEDAGNVETRLPPRVRQIGTVAEKTTGCDVPAPDTDRWNPAVESQCDVKPLSVEAEQGIGAG